MNTDQKYGTPASGATAPLSIEPAAPKDYAVMLEVIPGDELMELYRLLSSRQDDLQEQMLHQSADKDSEEYDNSRSEYQNLGELLDRLVEGLNSLADTHISRVHGTVEGYAERCRLKRLQKLEALFNK